jgi:septal ring factor EnvC (AmiA/AmiB activator)
MESLKRKKYQTEILKIKSSQVRFKKSHSRRLEQVENRISGLNDKTDIKEKTEEFLDKNLKSFKRNMQGLSDSIKRPNL